MINQRKFINGFISDFSALQKIDPCILSVSPVPSAFDCICVHTEVKMATSRRRRFFKIGPKQGGTKNFGTSGSGTNVFLLRESLREGMR